MIFSIFLAKLAKFTLFSMYWSFYGSVIRLKSTPVTISKVCFDLSNACIVIIFVNKAPNDIKPF